jgi:hypothetical protein
MKEHTELTLNCLKKWDLIRYIIVLQKTINKAIKRLDKVSDKDVRAAIKILRCENVRISDQDTWGD